VTFNPPAKPTALENFSEKKGLPVPEEMRRAWLVADGESRKSAGMIGNWRLMPIAEIQAAWGLLTQIAEKGVFSDKEPIKSPYLRHEWWHASWIPVATSDTGTISASLLTHPRLNRLDKSCSFSKPVKTPPGRWKPGCGF
jgi:cell wall assembly regulator SMI1